MDKQIFNIRLLENDDIRFKNGRTETPYNRVVALNAEYVEVVVNDGLLVTIDTEEYFKYALWANPLHMDHSDIRRGVVAVENGYTHKSVAALIMQTKPGQRVSYRDNQRRNLRKSNLYIIGEHEEEE